MRDKNVLYGAENATLDVAVGLAASGQVELRAVTFHDGRCDGPDSPLQQAFRDRGINCHSIATRRGLSLGLVRTIRRHLASHSVDCLHVVGYQASVHGTLAARFGCVCPCVHTVHGWLNRPLIKERFYDWIDLQMLKRAQRVIVLSNFYRKRLTTLGVAKERIAWIPSGLDLANLGVDERSKPFAAPNGPPTIGILGRLSSEKNHAMFLRVARQVLQNGHRVRFLIAGDGPERKNLETLIDQLELADAVEMPGVMDRDQFFPQVDLLAVCSQIENLPYCILEGMAWSRPVVATNVGGVSDLVHCGTNGRLVNDGDVDGMSTAISQLLQDVPRAQAMAVAGRQLLEQNFTLQHSVESHLRLYRQVVRFSSA